MKKCLALLLFAGLSFCSVAQQKQIKKPDGQKISTLYIDSLVKHLMDTAEVAGLALGIINDNKIAYIKSYGFKNKAKQALNDTATCFYGASLAKPLFAYIVLQLADSGLIDLDKPLYTYLPKPLPKYEKYKDLAADERYKLITARHCLSHTSGFPNWRWVNPHGNKKLEIFFTPGERYAYAGEGLVLLQMVIEIITGRPLEELAQEKIFKPFGMVRSSFIWQPSFETNYAFGHDMNGELLSKNKRKRADAAGSMETTIADYSRFIEAVMQGKRLSKKMKAQMIEPQIGIYTKHQFPSLNNDTTNANKNIQLSYGLGWGIFISPFGKAFFKEGHDDGWGHYSIHFPEKKISVIIMTNSSNGESIFKELVEKITGVTVPWEWEGYIPYRATVPLPKEILQQFIGEYDGILKVIITMENGQLKAAAPSAELAASNLYAQNDHHFFLKVKAAELEFVKGADGKIEKIILDDEGEKYELKKIK